MNNNTWIDVRKLLGVGLAQIEAEDRGRSSKRWITPHVLDMALRKGVYIFRNKLQREVSDIDPLREWSKEDIITDIWDIKQCKLTGDGSWVIPYNRHLSINGETALEFHIYTGGTKEELKHLLFTLDDLIQDNYLETRFNIEIPSDAVSRLSTVDICVYGGGITTEWVEFLRDSLSKLVSIRKAYIPSVLEVENNFCMWWNKEEYFRNKKSWILGSYRILEDEGIKFVGDAKEIWNILPLNV